MTLNILVCYSKNFLRKKKHGSFRQNVFSSAKSILKNTKSTTKKHCFCQRQYVGDVESASRWFYIRPYLNAYYLNICTNYGVSWILAVVCFRIFFNWLCIICLFVCLFVCSCGGYIVYRDLWYCLIHHSWFLSIRFVIFERRKPQKVCLMFRI